jgi:carboxymethylenebutenolidase
MTDEDLLLERPVGEFGSGVVGICDVCHQRQAVIVLGKERFKLCVLDFLNKSWVKSEAKPEAPTAPFVSSREYLPCRAVPGGEVPVVVLSPTRVVKRASALVVPEVYGLTTQVLEAGVRLAHEGFEVVMPDFAKTPGINLGTYLWLRGYRMLYDSVPVSRTRRERYLRVLDSCREYVQSRNLVDPSRFGVLGVSYGGALALAYAAQTPEVNVVGLAYPFMIRPASWLRQMKAPVLAVYGSSDTLVAPSLLLLREAAARYGFPFDSLVLAGARHHFLNRDSKAYRVAEAELAWTRLMAHMRAGLEPPKPAPPKPPHVTTSLPPEVSALATPKLVAPPSAAASPASKAPSSPPVAPTSSGSPAGNPSPPGGTRGFPNAPKA